MNDLFQQLYGDLLFGDLSQNFERRQRRVNKDKPHEVLNFNWTPYTSDDKLKAPYPYNLIQTEKGITIEVAAIGLDIDDIDIELEGSRIKVSHTKSKEDKPDGDYIYKKITNKSFELNWTLSSSLDLSTINASLDKGLLSIDIALKEDATPKKIKIK
jgi:HSP20 family molecular chaperone IbpA